VRFASFRCSVLTTLRCKKHCCGEELRVPKEEMVCGGPRGGGPSLDFGKAKIS